MKVGSHQMDYAAIARERQTMTQQPPDREAIARKLWETEYDAETYPWAGEAHESRAMYYRFADAILSSFPQTRPSESGEKI